MSTQEQLQRAREELSLFRQAVQEDTRINQEGYAQRLDLMRKMQEGSPDFHNLDFGGILGGDTALAMVMGQLNIEARIQALEAQAAQEAAVVQVAAQQIVAPPPGAAPPPDLQAAAPVQVLSRGQRIKRWFKRTFSRKSSASTPAQAAPVQAAPVQAQGAPTQASGDCTAVIPMITNLQVASRVSEVKRFGKPDNPDPDTPDTVVTRREIQGMREGGARGADGKFLAQRNIPLFAATLSQTEDMFQALEQTPGFDFATAVQGMKAYSIGVGDVQVNQASVAMVARAMEMMQDYLQSDHMQEYIRILYDGVGNVLVDNVKHKQGPDAMPTDADFDDHIMEILPTRGLDCFRSQCIKQGIAPENRTFALQCSKLMSKMSHVEKFCATSTDAEAVAMLQPIVARFHALRAQVSQIGAGVRAQRLADMRAAPDGGASGGV